jgi:hypothetical protein
VEASAPEDDVPGPLDRVSETLADVAAVLRQVPEPEWTRCLALVDASRDAASRAAATLAARAAALDPAALGRWRHALTAPLTAIAGWGQLLQLQPEKGDRAVESIERNARRLMELLARLPD